MLLTLKPALQNGFVNGGPHAYSSPTRPPSPKIPPPPAAPTSLPPLPDHPPRRMSTPHRGTLPPLTLPNPERSNASSGLPYGQLPQPPPQWPGHEDNMRAYLRAYEELQRRAQEEERTRQEEARIRSENVRLETSREHHTMFQEALRAGMWPNLVPIMFAGMAGPGGADIAQRLLSARETQQEVQLQQNQHPSIHHLLQLQQHATGQPQQPQTSPQAPPPPSQQPQIPQGPQQPQSQQAQYQQQQSRLLVGPQPNPYGPAQLQNLPASGPPPTSQPGAFISSYQPSPADRNRTQQQPVAGGPPPTSMPRPRGSSTSELPRLNALEISSQHPTPVLPGQTLHQGPQQNPAHQQQHSSSPTIFFHHWQPPISQSQSKDRDPPTPSTKTSNESPYSQSASSHLRSEYKESPKKRKALGPHQQTPAPPSNLSDTSPQFSSSSTRRPRGHSRQPSDTSQHVEGRYRARTESGQQSLSEAESGSRHQSAQPETRHPQRPAGPEMRTGSSFSERNSPKREPEAPS